MTTTANKAQMLEKLEELLRDALMLHDRGASVQKLTHAQGMVDGFMVFLLDSGLCTQRELLTLVKDARSSVDGPAVGVVSHEPNVAAA